MSTALLRVQPLNGLQFGVLLFLLAAGLTLVFGVMDFTTRAHGVQYMLGAYFAVMFYGMTGSFLAALVLALIASLGFGLLLEFAVFRHLYDRDHLDQVIATFGIILFLNQGVKIVWGAAPLSLPIPNLFSGTVVLMPGLVYPVWRLVIIACGLAGAHCRAGDRLDADLSADGGRALCASERPVSGAGPLNGRSRGEQSEAGAARIRRRDRAARPVRLLCRAAARRRRRADLSHQPVHADHDLCDRRRRARSHSRLWRADLVRPCRFHRARRLCRRHSRRPRHP